VNTVGGYGIDADSVSDCAVYLCGAGGIIGTTAQNCYAGTTGGGAQAIFCRNVNNCTGLCSGPSSYGIYSFGVVNNSYGQTGTGYGIYAGTATGSQGITTSAASGIGVYATTVENCYGSGANYGVWATTALNTSGATSNGFAIYAGEAQNCDGEASGSGNGIQANSIAQNCYRVSTAGFGAGVQAELAIGCIGVSANGYGVLAPVCQNCFGSSNTGTGLSANDLAIGCYGYSFNGTGLYSFLANSCVGASGASGTPESVTHKYNMP
jgi:hypothetical protein